MIPEPLLLAIGCTGIAATLWLTWQALRPAIARWRTMRAIARNLLGEEDDRNVR